MDLTKSELVERGWTSIGYDGTLEYFAKENEHNEILYIPVYEEKTIGNVRSMPKNAINILYNFINQ